MRFKYHQPVPNCYSVKNPTEPLNIASDKVFKNLEKMSKNNGCIGCSYVKLSEEFKEKWNFSHENIILFNYFMPEDIILKESSKNKAKLLDNDFQVISNSIFGFVDYLRGEGFSAELINPLDDKMSLRAIALQSNDYALLRSNMCMFNGYLNISFFPVATSITNLPINKENNMDWVLDFCKTCGKCIRKCPEDAYDENEKVISKKCLAHREGCNICMTVCPFFKKGYNKIKEKYDKRKVKS